MYKGLMDHLANEAAVQGLKPGRIIILPSGFQGSPIAMQQNYQDAMAVVRKYGKPDLFITFTCNPKSKEIGEQLFPGQTPSDRPDQIARVFKLKLNELIDDIIKKYLFGRAAAHVFVIEFQKRGLPHCHMLIILADESKPRDSNSIDRIVSSKIPDPVQFTRLYEIVKSHMIHGPCRVLNIFSNTIYKGHDCANIKLDRPVQDGITTSRNLEWDEIKAHLDARYVSAPEAAWRLFEFPLHDKSHSIIRPAVHLPNMQPVYFAEGNEKDTTLTAWFKLNRDNPNARIYHYHDIPNHFVFDRDDKCKRRQQGEKNHWHNVFS
jgi:hypothetical protein